MKLKRLTIKDLVINGLLVISLITYALAFQPIYVQGDSMSQTMPDGSIWLTTRIGRQSIDIGDQVIFHPPIIGRENELFVKNVVAIAGDVLTLDDEDQLTIQHGNLIYRTNVVMNENCYNFDYPYTIPDGYFFALGEIQRSNDSRYFGLVPVENIQSKNLCALPDFGILHLIASIKF
jgi:signal peptidase I